MGLHTTFVGHVAITPPLSLQEVEFVRCFGHTRHWDQDTTELRLARHPADNEPAGAGEADSRPAEGMPGMLCPWTVCTDGCCLHWDGIEKPSQGEAWLRCLVERFLMPGASVAGTPLAVEHGLTCDHVLEGVLVGERHETGELFALEVVANTVNRRTLVAARPGVTEWGNRSDQEERRERKASLAARRRRFEAALAADRAEWHAAVAVGAEG